MRPGRGIAALLWLLAIANGGPAAAQPARAEATGRQVKSAIRDGVEALLRAQQPNGAWPEPQLPGGQTCLAALALLATGQPPDAPPVQRAIERIRELPDQHTYVVSLKIMALATADPQAYRDEIRAATRWLVRAQRASGLWTYTDDGDRWDHSNTQFALLGLHAASQAGAPVPAGVWSLAQNALTRTQNRDGGWAYQLENRSYGSMTAAGVANLLILGRTFNPSRERGFRDGAAPGCGSYRVNRPLARGFEWLERNFQAGTNPARGDYVHYWLYAAERVGILSGRRFFGLHDWYRAGANILVKTQRGDGTWNNSLSDTCFALLFLAKGHRSLLIQKLQWSSDDAWSPDRHDVENLVAFIDDQLGQPVSWQSVPFDAPLEEWLASPLLYMQGHKFPQWNEAQRAKVRAYIEQGGTLLAEACCGRVDFREGFERFAQLAFPESPLRELGPAHAAYRVLHEVEPYGLKGIDYGCRTAVIYSPNDMSCLWEQANIPLLSEAALRLGTNIAAYAAGRRPLLDRLDAVVLPARVDEAAPVAGTSDALRLAHVVYDGDWQPFPLAPVRLAEFLREQAGLDVVTRPRQVRLDEPELRLCPILWLSGSTQFELPAPQRAALAAHLRRGGFLVLERCCGGEGFDASVRPLVAQILPEARFDRLPPDHPVFVGAPGFDLRRVRYSPDVLRERPGQSAPELWGAWIEGRLALVYSPFSLSCGLSGPEFDGCWGLASQDAQRLAANIVVSALVR